MTTNKYCDHRWLETKTIGGIKCYWHCIFCKKKMEMVPAGEKK